MDKDCRLIQASPACLGRIRLPFPLVRDSRIHADEHRGVRLVAGVQLLVHTFRPIFKDAGVHVLQVFYLVSILT